MQVKEKGGSFGKNKFLGETIIQLDNLELSKHTVGWYRLHQRSAADVGSAESLNFYR